MTDTSQAADGDITPTGTTVQTTAKPPCGATTPTGAVVRNTGKAVGTG